MLLTLDNRFDHQGQSVAWGCVGEGDAMVMIHGFPWSAQAWRRVVPWLVKNNKKLYFFDMIGCGQSEMRDDQDVSPAVQNDLLAALFQHWELDRPEIVAHDFGGLTALRGYYLNHLRYRRLTLINAVGVLPSGSPGFRYFRQHEQVLAGLPAYAHEALLRAYIGQTSYRTLSEEAVDIYIQPWLQEAGQAAFYRQIAHSGDRYIAEIQSLYGPMEGRVDIVWAEEDSFIPLNQGREIATLLAADSFTPIPEASHLVQEDAPEAIVAALLSNPD